MNSKLSLWVHDFLKARSFWKDNYLILREFKHFRGIAILAIIFALVSAFLTGTTVGLISSFLQGITNPSEPPIHTGIEWFDTLILASKATPSQRVWRLSILILFVIWLRSLFSYLNTLYSQLAALSLVKNLRLRIFNQLQTVSLSYYSQVNSGDLLNSITIEAHQMRQAFIIISTFISAGFTLLAYWVSMLLLSWQLSVTAFAIFSLMSVVLSNISARVREASFAVPKANGDFTSMALEYINGVRTVKASATQDFEQQRFRQVNNQVITAITKMVRLSNLVSPLVQGVSSTLVIVLVLVAFNLLVVNGKLSAASLLTFLFALSRTTPLLSQLNNSKTQFSSFQGALDNVHQVLREDDKPYLRDGKRQFTHFKNSIELVGVDFGYSPEEQVLHNLHLSIPQGKTTALVGGSGAGKSTLVDLIARFYDPTQGQIIIDGSDLRTFQVNSLRRKMAIVSQDTFIFNTSVRENIAYGVEFASENMIREAASLANALDFIEELPEGFDTKLGDRGVRLSGGQRQRIAIARAILRDPDILILDEATSALDSVTERLIQDSLDKLSTGRTVIAIAHRLSTIMGADQVVVLEKGRIVEQGRYQDLLARRGQLWKYHKMQHEVIS